MMLNCVIGFAISLALVGAVSAGSRSWGVALQEQAPADETLPVDPWSLPRVVGEARSQEEWDAWQLIERAATLAESAELARRFIESYPQSGLVPNAHHIVASYLYELGDLDNFTPHAESAIAELPAAVDLLSQLAFIYAESGRADLAIDRATRALEAVEGVQRPPSVAPEVWVGQVYQLKAEANYALGRAHLGKIGRDGDRAQDPNLNKAIDFLETALEYDPRHDYACFRLGFAERNANHAGGALSAYAKAVAIGGVAAGPAQQELEEVLGIVQQTMPDSEWAEKSAQELVAQAGLELQHEASRVRAEQEREAELLRERETLEPRPTLSTPTFPESPGN
jgi:tetratricopeptide (TPR) repeat protein